MRDAADCGSALPERLRARAPKEWIGEAPILWDFVEIYLDAALTIRCNISNFLGFNQIF